MAIGEISVQELKQRMDNGEKINLIDVRELAEYQAANMGGQLIPLSQLQFRYNEIDRSREVVVHCRSGVRSMTACQFLEQMGFEKLTNLRGGILAWAGEVDSSLRP